MTDRRLPAPRRTHLDIAHAHAYNASRYEQHII